MPSFVIHTTCALKLIDKLNINEIDKKKFIIGNLLPDSRSLVSNPDWTYEEERKHIQEEKLRTHFRTNLDEMLQYPNMELFISKYKNEVKTNIVTLACMFHLYTDYYFFKYYLPKTVTFLDESNNETSIKKEIKNVLINKTNEKISNKLFWNKTNNKGIYQEYTRLNNYILKEYSININCNELIECLNTSKFEANINEIDSNNSYQVVKRLEKILIESQNIEDKNLYIFDTDSINIFINEVVISFISQYNEIIKNIKN